MLRTNELKHYVFEPIPFEDIGLYEDDLRATWPVEHEPEQRTRRKVVHDFMEINEDQEEAEGE